MAAGSTYTPIATTTLGSAANSFTFSSIPSTYTDLILVVDGEVSVTAGCLFQFNGVGGTSYSFTYLYGTGSSAISGRGTSGSYIFATDLTTTRSTVIAQIQNYSNTTTYKTAIFRGGAAGFDTAATVGLFASTSAISSIKVYADAARTFSIGSTFTLYGIKAA